MILSLSECIYVIHWVGSKYNNLDTEGEVIEVPFSYFPTMRCITNVYHDFSLLANGQSSMCY